MDWLYDFFSPSAAANVTDVPMTTPGRPRFGPTDSMPPLPGQPDKAVADAELAALLDPASWNTTVTPATPEEAGGAKKSLGDKIADALSGLSAQGMTGNAGAASYYKALEQNPQDALEFYKMAIGNIPANRSVSLSRALPRGGR